MDIERAKEVLLKLREDLDSRGVDFWLREGTLLGAVRDGEFFEWEHDIDISIRADDWPSDLPNHWTVRYKWWPERQRIVNGATQCSIRANPESEGSPSIDVMLQYHCPSRGVYLTLERPWGGSMRTSIPTYFMDTPNYIDFLGTQFRIPLYPEMVLQSIYGDWRTPYKGKSSEWRKNWGEFR